MRVLLARLLFDDQAQDLIEYALLSAGLGFAGLASWPAIQTGISASYTTLDTASQNLWQPPPPGGP